jgi:hypothetical protein
VCRRVPSKDLKALGNQQHRPRGTAFSAQKKGSPFSAHGSVHHPTLVNTSIHKDYHLVNLQPIKILGGNPFWVA